MTLFSDKPRLRPRPGTPKFEYWYVSSRSRALYADSETPQGILSSRPYWICRLTTSRLVCASRLVFGARSTRSGIRYSNIEPDQDTSAAPAPIGVTVRPSRNQ